MAERISRKPDELASNATMPIMRSAVYEIQWFSDAPLTQMVGSATVTASEMEIQGLERGKTILVPRTRRTRQPGRPLVRSGHARRQHLTAAMPRVSSASTMRAKAHQAISPPRWCKFDCEIVWNGT